MILDSTASAGTAHREYAVPADPPQLAITRKYIAAFDAAIEAARAAGPSEGTDPVVFEAYLAGMESMRNSLIADEERLRDPEETDDRKEDRE